MTKSGISPAHIHAFDNGNGKRLQSYLPEYLTRFCNEEDRIDRGFLITENGNGLDSNNAIIRDGFSWLTQHAPFSDRDFVFIDRSTEIGVMRQRRKLLMQGVRRLGLPVENLIYVAQNPKTAIRPAAGAPSFLWMHYYAILMARSYAPHDHDFGFDAAGHQVLCLNHKRRAHRLALLQTAQQVLADQVMFSWAGGLDWPHADADFAQTFPLLAKQPWTEPSPVTLPPSLGLTEAVADVPVSAVHATMLHLVAETEVFSYVQRFTEKLLKPIAVHRPFVVFGVPGVLQQLRELGFMTFHTVFDETYDTVTDPEARLAHIKRTLQQIARMDPAEFKAGVREICAYNQAHLRDGLETYLWKRFRNDLRALTAPKPGGS